MNEEKTLKTLRVRVKDKHAEVLNRMARQVTTVWNFVNETSSRSIRERQRFLSAYDLQKYTAGYTKCEGVVIRSATVDAVCEEYVTKRRMHRKAKLAWRVSNKNSSRYSLGWIPLKACSIRVSGGQVHYGGRHFGIWDSYGLTGYKLRSGSFSQDARGRWYFNVCAELDYQKGHGTTAIGIDLGLKTAVTVSDGQRLEGRQFRASEAKLASAQRAGKKKLARNIHAKIRNQRKDAQHKFSTSLVQHSGAIFVGDVSSLALEKTTMAKSVKDAGWGQLKIMLKYKCHQAGVVFDVVNERYTTQACNTCGVIAGPKGRAGLNKRVWQCVCGAVHDRDVNAALNIRRIGLDALAEGAGAGNRDRSSQNKEKIDG